MTPTPREPSAGSWPGRIGASLAFADRCGLAWHEWTCWRRRWWAFLPARETLSKRRTNCSRRLVSPVFLLLPILRILLLEGQEPFEHFASFLYQVAHNVHRDIVVRQSVSYQELCDRTN